MSRERAFLPPGNPGGRTVRAAAKPRLPGCIEDACTNVTFLQLPLEYSSIFQQEHILYAQKLFITTFICRSERNSLVRACLCAPCPAPLSVVCRNKIAGPRILLSHGSRGEMRRQEARALRRRSGEREAKGRRRREKRGHERQGKRARAGGQGRGSKRRRAIVVSDSDSDSEGHDEGAELAGGQVQRRLVAGRLVAGRKRKRDDVPGGGGSEATAGGSDGERHQAAVAEARRHLGGGGERRWVE